MSRKGDSQRHEGVEGYDSSFEDEDLGTNRRPPDTENELKKKVQASTSSNHSQGLPSRDYFQDQQRRAEGYRNNYFALNAYERHQKLINDYVLYYPGARKALLKRNSSKDKNDRDIIQENHRFLWDDSEDANNSWEKQLAKKYYDKLFKEYGVCDLSKYKENKIAIRWRTGGEVIDGKGQFICGEKKCPTKESLRTWEVNFAYMEDSIKKNALVKLRLCTSCSLKLNYCQQRKEVTKKPKKRKISKLKKEDMTRKRGKLEVKVKTEKEESTSKTKLTDENPEVEAGTSTNIWKETVVIPEMKSREDEFDEYLDDLFL